MERLAWLRHQAVLVSSPTQLLPACCSRSAATTALLEAVQQGEHPASPLGSFPAIFAQSMALGLLSRRRVHQLAQQHLAGLQRPGLDLRWTAGSRLRPSVPAQSALAASEASDFHWHLAASDRVRWGSSAGQTPAFRCCSMCRGEGSCLLAQHLLHPSVLGGGNGLLVGLQLSQRLSHGQQAFSGPMPCAGLRSSGLAF